MKKLPIEDAVNYAINDFAKKENPSICDWQRVKVVADIQQKLLDYAAQSDDMSFKDLKEEQHDSGRLASHLAASGDPRPHKECDCHAIVSGRHSGAALLRALMAQKKMRIDMPANGCWLPRNTKSLVNMPAHLRKAVPHSRIHRKGYYIWVNNTINFRNTANRKQLEQKLNEVSFHLQNFTFPENVMLPASKQR